MNVRDVINLLNCGAVHSSANGFCENEISLLQLALEPFSEHPVADFCTVLGQLHKKKESPKSPKRNRPAPSVDRQKVADVLNKLNYAIDHMKCDDVCFDHIDGLVGDLSSRRFSKDEVLAVAKEFHVSARTKKQAVSEIKDMLVDLKATANKSRMYK